MSGAAEAGRGGGPGPGGGAASESTWVVTRSVDAPARVVFDAWTQAALFRRWWVPASAGLTLLSCEMDARVGGRYRLVFQAVPEPLAFHGTYLEVTAPSRLVWTNDESGGSGPVTTVTFEEQAGRTLIVLQDRYPSSAALDEAVASGTASGDMAETFDQLDALLAAGSPR